MKKLAVYYEGWGERWLLGTLAQDHQDLLFEYSAQALQRGLELSPRHLPLRAQAYGDFPSYLSRLPGLVADALPDGWGLLVMDRLFHKHRRPTASITPLDRLAFIGANAMGALTFEPAEGPPLAPQDLQLLQLSQATKAIVADKSTPALQQLALLGGSPHGARPKVLVHYNPQTGMISSDPRQGSAPWLVKFPAKTEHPEVCRIEHLYAHLARLCLLDMPTTEFFNLSPRASAFGIARFDRDHGMRVPIHTLAGFLHLDFRIAGCTNYLSFLRATQAITRDVRETFKAFERAVFNVVFNNRDDHPKNFSYRLNAQGQWQLAPCYDLTFCEGPGGEHQMDVSGEGRHITRQHLLQLASSAQLDPSQAQACIDRVLAVARQFKAHAQPFGIRTATVGKLSKVISANIQRVS